MAADVASNQIPSPWVVRFTTLIAKGGEVLDLACGYGRHARFLAQQGFRVEAVDRDHEALASLSGIENLVTRCADLEGGPWPYYHRDFDGIIVSRFLWRPLLPQLIQCLRPDGVLIYETFMEGQQLYGKPENPAHLLRPGELLELVYRKLTVVAFEQGETISPSGTRQVIQRLCARRGPPGVLPPCLP